MCYSAETFRIACHVETLNYIFVKTYEWIDNVLEYTLVTNLFVIFLRKFLKH